MEKVGNVISRTERETKRDENILLADIDAPPRKLYSSVIDWV
jgi:hypothetical protein